MYEIPKDYEEARKVLVESTKDEMNKRTYRMLTVKSLLVSILGTGAIAALSTALGFGAPIEVFLPLAGFIEFEELIPIIQKKIQDGKIRNGKYFENKRKEEIMGLASDYAKIFNKFEERENIKKGR